MAETQWIPSACSICYSQCSIKVKIQNGLALKIEGNPASPIGNGRLCPKGASGLMLLYDPNRLNVPLMRTNPEKGIGVDPKWKEISWDEALEIITEKLRGVRADDPRKLIFQRTTTSPNSARTGMCWALAFGSPNLWTAGGGLHCGNGAHQINGTFHASWSLVPDYDYCEYAIYFGASKGHSAGHSANPNALKASDARARGMRLVVVDPLCNFAASKATEWVPIRVGTDAALALSMVNVLLNELDLYDREHIKNKTNGPYLVGADGLYVRDQTSQKPLIWDSSDGRPKTYDDPSLAEAAILGEFTVNGTECRPGFQLIKDHVRKYSPEHAASITSVPAKRIRELASEFARHARIGSTIEIEGKKLPYRPVSAAYFRGVQGHKNSLYNCLSIELLNQVVGASDVPGGALGFCSAMHGHPESGKPYYQPYAGPDGLLVPGVWPVAHKPYPPPDVPETPNTLTLTDLFPLTMCTAFLGSADQEDIWRQLGLDYRPEILVNFGANPVLSVGNPGIVVEALKKIPFIVSFDLFITEFSELADIVLPDTSYLERLDAAPQWTPLLNHPSGPGTWAWPIRQPVLERPVGERRNFQEILLELADRVGFTSEFNAVMNLVFPVQGDFALAPDTRYTWEEICDRRLKTMFGSGLGLEYFKQHGLVTWPKKVEEVYFLPFTDVRLPIYYEFLGAVGKQERALFERLGFADRVDWSRYDPLPDWTPCHSHLEKDASFDLYGFYYRDVLHTNSFTYENPWLDEMARMNPYSYYAVINRRVADAKGLQPGDPIVIESATGRKVKGFVMPSEAVHPEALAVGGCAGHYTEAQPVAKGKGIRFNELLEVDLEHCDPVNLTLDLCVKVKIYRDPELSRRH